MQFPDVERKVRFKPFKPFRIYLTDGSSYEVRHPEMILLGKRMAVVGVTANPNETAFDRAVDIDLLHIVKMEHIEADTPTNNA